MRSSDIRRLLRVAAGVTDPRLQPNPIVRRKRRIDHEQEHSHQHENEQEHDEGSGRCNGCNDVTVLIW